MCGKSAPFSSDMFFNLELGLLCHYCSKDRIKSQKLSVELFSIINCLSSRNLENTFDNMDIQKVINFFEKYLMYHIPEFKGIKSLKIF